MELNQAKLTITRYKIATEKLMQFTEVCNHTSSILIALACFPCCMYNDNRNAMKLSQTQLKPTASSITTVVVPLQC